ncbi:efflux RND transporter periplasmic adaptor subunit [Ideonella sp. YS5]|uniref:efflux RND transporter periplasmic adaptor subunit n=1 Tax=Ideonella sp. YS5 TaxID=3453714 RepID=UPI003EE9B707
MAMADTTSSTPDPHPIAPALAGLAPDQRAGRGRRRRRWPWVAAVLLVIAAAAATFVPRKTEVQAASVQTAYPSQQYTQLAASGYVVAQRRAAVSSKATGRLVELNVREGSLVRKGELLARLDAADVSASLGVSEAGLRQSEAALQQAEANLKLAQSQQANADDELRRVLGLSGQGFVSPQSVDAAQTRARSAAAGTAAAQAALATARAGVGQARAQVRLAQVNRDSTEIRAPFDGVVLVKNANVGDLITPFSNAVGTSGAVVTMADLSTLEVEADVSESSVGKVRADQPVEITLDALPDVRFRGSVSRIVPTVDRAKATVMTKVRFEKLDPRVLPEMSAKVSFLSQAATDADQKAVLAVSARTITEREGRKLVFRIDADDKLQAVPVTPGRTLGDVVEVASGTLQRGDRIVVDPDPKLQAGRAVAVSAK